MESTCPICGTPLAAGAAACPSCGFHLVGSTQRFAPVIMEGAAPEAPRKEATLTVVHGPQIGTVYRLEGERVAIGRSPQCEIFLNDMTVSRAHAALEWEQGSWVIRDTNSYNGVWLNNEAVTEARLIEGDRIQFGSFVLCFSQVG